MNEPTLKLQRNAEELLREFPGSEPDFEAQARAIEARLNGSPGGVVFDDLLRVPELEPEPGEGTMPSSVRAAQAPKSNFAEMARKSVQKTDDAKELAKELLAATAASRRPNAEMVERVRAAGRTAATSTPLPTTEAAQDEARPSGVVTRAVAPAAAAAAAPSNNNGNRIGIIFGVVGSLVAVAACVALFLKSGADDGRSAAATAAAQKANEAPAVAAAPAAPAPVAKSNDGVVSPEALKEVSAAPPHEVAAGVAPKAAGAAAAAAVPGSKAVPSATPSAVAQQAVVLEEDPEPAQVAAAEPKAAPAAEPPLQPAEGTTGSVPLTPSGGAVSTALRSVRASAQACLAGQTEPVNATVTFASDGHVLRVSAGGPAAACIQAALSKAHIAPFAKESFSAPTTIRPP